MAEINSGVENFYINYPHNISVLLENLGHRLVEASKHIKENNKLCDSPYEVKVAIEVLLATTVYKKRNRYVGNLELLYVLLAEYFGVPNIKQSANKQIAGARTKQLASFLKMIMKY